LKRYIHNHSVDGLYVFGEASFDSVEQMWFDDVDALTAALNAPEFEAVQAARDEIMNPRYVFSMVSRENWVIGPDARD
jgi:hypothetical protein